MKPLLITISALSLAGCMSTAKDVEGAIQRSLPQICTSAEVIHVAFLNVAPTLKPATVQKEAAAYGAVKVFCASPSTVTLPELIVRATAAYATYVAVAKVGA